MTPERKAELRVKERELNDWFFRNPGAEKATTVPFIHPKTLGECLTALDWADERMAKVRKLVKGIQAIAVGQPAVQALVDKALDLSRGGINDS